MSDIKGNLQKVYDALIREGYVDIGNMDEFTTSMQNERNRKKVYDALQSSGYKGIGKNFDAFNGLVYAAPKPVEQPKPQQSAASKPVAQQPIASVDAGVKATVEAMPKAEVKPQQMQQAQVEQPKPQPKPKTKAQQPHYDVNLPTIGEMMENAQAQTASAFAPMFDTETSRDENGNKHTQATLVPGLDKEGKMAMVYRDALTGKEYDPNDTSEETQKAIKRGRQFADRTMAYDNVETIDPEQQNREQVASMFKDVDAQLNEAYKTAQAKYEDAKPSFLQGLLHDMADASHGAGPMRTDNAYETLVNNDKDVRALSAAKRSLKDAQELIAEADKSVKEGNFDGFFKGAGRGLGNKTFDARTWDMGLEDAQNAGAILEALNTFDNGGKLTPAQQTLLDAKAVELATNAYFGSYIGRGYKAGEVTAESLPFMLEMCINPASGTGKAAQSMLTRYALKRFGKKAIEKNAGKYMAAKVGTRVVGDVAGAAAMTATTGAVRTIGDATQRMQGEIQHDTDAEGNTVFAGHTEGDDAGTAFAKAFAGTTIENYSEMFGNYFGPVLRPITDKVGGAVTRGMEKVGLGKVNDFIAGVKASDVAKVVSDFEKHSQWNGVFGEYAEEVAGNIMNAAIVGDMTMDNAEGTGVFNRDQNIDTFLGVSLMGGFMSGVKTLGYRTPKYRQKQAMTNADDAASVTFGNQDKWGEVRNTIAFGSDEERHDKLVDVLTSDDYTEEQKRATMQYAKEVEKYKGMQQADQKRREDESTDPLQTDAETSFENGYSLATAEEMNDAKHMLEYRAYQLRNALGINEGEENDIFKVLGGEEDPVNAVIGMRDTHTEEQVKAATDYLNAKATWDGMITRVQDEIADREGKIAAKVDMHTNKQSGMIQPATMKLDDRKVYVVGGNIVPFDDGTINHEDSDETVIIRDAETDKLEQVDPRDIFTLDVAVDPAEEKERAQQEMRESVAQEASDKIDGVLPFAVGDNYTMIGLDGQQHTVAVQPLPVDDNTGQPVVLPAGTAWVSVDGAEATAMPMDAIQQGVENYNLGRLQDYEAEQMAQEAAVAEVEYEAARPVYGLNDEVTLRDENGFPVRGSVTAEENEDGKIEVWTENPINGSKVNLYSRDELDGMLMVHNGEEVNFPTTSETTEIVPETTENVPETPEMGTNEAESVPETAENVPISTELESNGEVAQRAIDRIPTVQGADGKTVHQWEQAVPSDTFDALSEMYGDEARTQKKIDKRIENIDTAIKAVEAEQSKLDDSDDFDADVANADAYQQLAQRKAELEAQKKYWQAVKRVPQDRRNEASKLEEEERKRLKAEREAAAAAEAEAARIERERVNGVPEMVEDKPTDARARGFRNVNGHVVERQNDTEGVVGREASVKFSKKDTVKGRIKVIEADQLQPSHIGGTANALHFIPEAQPKNRTDVVSSISAQDMAEHNNPKEITGDGSAYHFSAPTTNTRSEVIQGNNRGEALRLMWGNEAYKAQQEAYKQYLIDNAEEFGLDAEAIQAMNHPVMVNEVDVDDAEAIRLGHFTSKDNESGGYEAMDPTNVSRALGKNMSTFANILLNSSDENATLSELLAANAGKAIAYLERVGAINPTQVQSAYDGKGNVTGDAKKQLQDILKQSLFQGGVSDLPTMFDSMPAKAQKAILSTFMRDLNSSEDNRILSDIQQAIMVWYNAAHSVPEFAAAKTYDAARVTLEGYKRQTSMLDDNLPTDLYSPFAFELAARLQGTNMKPMQTFFNDFYDLVQGAGSGTLFGDKIAGEKVPLIEAIKRVFNVDFTNTNDNNNDEERGNNLGDNTEKGDQGGQGEPADTGNGERAEAGAGSADDTAGTEGDTGAGSAVSEPQPIGSGVFGNIYDQFRGKAKAAIDFLRRLKSGEAIGALHHKDIGEIALVWGNAKAGLQKIAKKHPEVLDNLQEIIDGMQVVQTSDNRIKLESDTHFAVVSRDWLGEEHTPWLLTAYEKKESSATNNTMDTADTHEGERNDTATPQDTASNGKGSEKSSTAQEKGGKVADNEGKKDKYLVSDERMEELKRRLRAKLGQLNMGVDPEVIAIGSELAVAHIERGARKFGDYAKAMIADIGDVVRPYLKAFYNAVRDMPGAEDYADEMTSYDDVRKFDVATIGKDGEDVTPSVLDTAEQVSNEQTVQQNADEIEVAVSETESTTNAAYTITPIQYTTKKKKVLDVFLVKPAEKMSAEGFAAATKRAAEVKGWYDRSNGGFLLRSEEDARQFAADTFGNPIGKTSTAEEIQAAREATNTNPTEGQKEAGNYAKGHIKVDGLNIVLENPKGSTRSGEDANGKKWSRLMWNDYGYISRTEGVDGDHIDVILSDNPASGNVYVCDQINQTDGSFDEHKVLYGFDSMEDARNAYASMYEEGWKIGTITEVSREDFKKWIESSKRKTKPFAEYKSVQAQLAAILEKANALVGKTFENSGGVRYKLESVDEEKNRVTLLDVKAGKRTTLLTPSTIVNALEDGTIKIVDDANADLEEAKKLVGQYVDLKNGKKDVMVYDVSVNKNGIEVRGIDGKKRITFKPSDIKPKAIAAPSLDKVKELWKKYMQANVGSPEERKEKALRMLRNHYEALLKKPNHNEETAELFKFTIKYGENYTGKDGGELSFEETMDNFYDNIVDEDALMNAPEDDVVVLAVVDVLNPNLTDTPWKKKLEYLTTSVSKISDGKLQELYGEYKDEQYVGSILKAEMKKRGLKPAPVKKGGTPLEQAQHIIKSDAKAKNEYEQGVESMYRDYKETLHNKRTKAGKWSKDDVEKAIDKTQQRIDELSKQIISDGKALGYDAQALGYEVGTLQALNERLAEFTTEPADTSLMGDSGTSRDEQEVRAAIGKTFVNDNGGTMVINGIDGRVVRATFTDADGEVKELRPSIAMIANALASGNWKEVADNDAKEFHGRVVLKDGRIGHIMMAMHSGEQVGPQGQFSAPHLDKYYVSVGKEMVEAKPEDIDAELTELLEAERDLPIDERTLHMEDGRVVRNNADNTSVSGENSVTLEQEELAGDSAEYKERNEQERDLLNEIAEAIVASMRSGEPLRMSDVKKMAGRYELLKDYSTTDLQELTELASVSLARAISMAEDATTKEKYDKIVDVYNAQPLLNARDSSRVEKQQYSTPTPFGFLMGEFTKAGRTVMKVLEPSAGNGALTIAFDPRRVHVNDIDDRRVANLRKVNFGKITTQDGTLPFNEKVDAMLTNPPFGNTTAREFPEMGEDYAINSLEGLMAINGLESMKDNGRAAIIIGGNTEYRDNGVMKPKDMKLFKYLYSHYNVVDVINLDGAMYARNGTKYPVRMILIDGRKTGEFSVVVPPTKTKGRGEQVKTFDELFNRVQDDIQQLSKVGSEPATAEPTEGSNGSGSKGNTGTSGRTNTSNGPRPVQSGAGSGGQELGGKPANTGNGGGKGSSTDQSRPSGVASNNGGNAGGTDNVQKPATERQSGNGNRGGNTNSGSVGGTERGASATESPANGGRLEVKLTDEKVPYPNRSQSGTLMSVVPATQAQVLSESLESIGDVDQFLVDNLGYSSKDELYGYLAAEQIDSVALAINQMNQGNAFIIGDMTGVGKGRQGAALIRYAVKQGKTPIYFTQKPALFADNYRDLSDIGSGELRPFIIASSKDGQITDAQGNVVHKLPTKKETERVFQHIAEHGTLPKEYDYVLATYSQIQNGTKSYEAGEDGIRETAKKYGKGKTVTAADRSGQVRREAIARLAKDNILILDESHTVGGSGGGAMFMQYAMQGASGATFLSATFAKRADNMPIYAMRTALNESGMKPQELIDAIAQGGVTLQEIMSKQLVQSGQMIRRERSFQGVTIDWMPVEEESDKKQRAQFDEVADIFNAIRGFQDEFIKPLVSDMSEDLADSGSYSGLTQGTEAMGVQNTPFASKMYNLVNQLLFALKADAVADRVIWNLEHGFKPVISFTNTMEGFLDEAPKDTPMPTLPNFSMTLLKALDGVMRYTVTDSEQNKEGNSFKVSDLSPEGQQRYMEIRQRIVDLSIDLSISPMDAIKMKIEAAGYKVGEITGRTTELTKDENGQYVVRNRVDRDKKAAARDFNNGKLDVLMINKSGSTGISLHSSPKFGDTRQRVMVFAQFQSDINDEVQMRGRIDRTGQVSRGKYEYIMSSIPAEQRLQMMFKAKLKSLDANTTSSQKSKFNEMEVVDYLNKYGDEVTWQYMREHPELSEKLGDPLKMLAGQDEESTKNPRFGKTEDKPQDGCAAKIARYLPFLPVKEQEEVFKEITEAYAVKMQMLNDAGENDLEITTMPLNAETKEKRIWKQGTNPNSGNAFADNTYLEEVEVDVIKKPMKSSEVESLADQMTGGVDFVQWREDKSQEIDEFYADKIKALEERSEKEADERGKKKAAKFVASAKKAREQGKNEMSDEIIAEQAQVVYAETMQKAKASLEKRKAEIRVRCSQVLDALEQFEPLKPLVIPMNLNDENLQSTLIPSYGTFVGFKLSKDFSPSTSTAVFATLDGRRKVELPLREEGKFSFIKRNSVMYGSTLREYTMEKWDSNVPTRTRKTAYIVTGNLLQALVDTNKDSKTKGYLVSYSTKDGETRQGILMSDRFQPTDLKSSKPISSTYDAIVGHGMAVSEDGEVTIEYNGYGWQGRYKLSVPKSTSRGAKYFNDSTLRKLVKYNEFETKGGNMVAYIDSDEDLKKALKRLDKIGVTVQVDAELKDEGKKGKKYRLLDETDDAELIAELESGPVETVYRAMSLINGQLYPPMATLEDGANLGTASPMGQWAQSDEAPQKIIKKNGKYFFRLYKPNGTYVDAAYNPYFHTSRSPLNDQFSSAQDRPEIVIVETQVPSSELTSGYKAQYAKDAVGEIEWKSGVMSNKLPKDKKRKVILSRWAKPVRIVPYNEVAGEVEKLFDYKKVEFPSNVLHPELRKELESRGYTIVETDNQGIPLSLESDINALADDMKSRLGVNVIIEDKRDLTDENDKKAKGWYDVDSGEIHLVWNNHRKLDDAKATLLHEAVAHQGLRELFGENFDRFLDNVYANASKGVRNKISNLAAKNGWDFRTATEEYLASLAEKTDFENAEEQKWWNKVKQMFIDLLNTLGFDYHGPELGDNELKYVLWRSYKNLQESAGRTGNTESSRRSVVAQAEDVAMQHQLGVGNYAKEKRYRKLPTDDVVDVVRGQRGEYDAAMRASGFQVQEALQDSMLSLKKLMDIMQKHSKQSEIADWENAYTAENALSSRNKAEQDEYQRKYYKPLMKAMRNLVADGMSEEDITDYVMSKHGIERNREMAVRAAIAAEEDEAQRKLMEQGWDDYKDLVRGDNITWPTWLDKQHALDQFAMNDMGADLDKRDFSGLTALFNVKKASDARTLAYQQVIDAEAKHDGTSDLLKAIKAANDATMEKLFTSGMISRATKESIGKMYDYYVPLRGFDETTAEEVYAYIRDERKSFNNPLKTAHGRKSKADNPFAHILSMADSAILQGNKNLMKQKFLNFVLNRPSDLVSVSDMWIERDPITDEWHSKFPAIPTDATPEEVADIVRQFNEDMQAEVDSGNTDIKRIKGKTADVPYRTLHDQLSEHQVIVKRDGKEYVLTINGNPRAAMALNGKTNPHSDYKGVGGAFKRSADYINRQLAGFYTTKNPDFVASNFVRDAIYSNSMVWVKESPRYAVRFHKNFVKFNPKKMGQLFHKWNHGKLDMSDPVEKEFYRFMTNGGETGYSNLKDIEKLKKQLTKDLDNTKLHQMKALFDRLGIINRSVENAARFAAYMSSREEGRSVQRSVYDAKEISVNFNKKGAGGTFYGAVGQTKAGNMAAGSSAACRALYVFFNAGVQGTTNIARAAKHHKGKFATLAACYFVLGLLAPMVMGGGDGDDDDYTDYDDLPDYVRRTNLIIPMGDSFISLPLPIEFRTMYGLGELATSVLSGSERYNTTQLARAMGEQVTQALPINFLEGEGTGMLAPFVPSIAAPLWQAHENKDWTGMPIYKDNDYNKKKPEWTKAYGRTNRHLVNATKGLNNATGGDEFTKGAIDLNPALIESVVQGYFGGFITFLNKMSNSVDMATGNMEANWRNVPIANRLMKSGNEATKTRAVNREYFNNISEWEEIHQREKGYISKIQSPTTDLAEKAEWAAKLDELHRSEEWKNMQVFNSLNKQVKHMGEIQKNLPDEDKDLQRDILNLKRQANEVARGKWEENRK